MDKLRAIEREQGHPYPMTLSALVHIQQQAVFAIDHIEATRPILAHIQNRGCRGEMDGEGGVMSYYEKMQEILDGMDDLELRFQGKNS